jgi:predicted transcriptional regulator
VINDERKTTVQVSDTTMMNQRTHAGTHMNQAAVIKPISDSKVKQLLSPQELKLVNLIANIVVNSTITAYETGNKVPKV